MHHENVKNTLTKEGNKIGSDIDEAENESRNEEHGTTIKDGGVKQSFCETCIAHSTSRI